MVEWNAEVGGQERGRQERGLQEQATQSGEWLTYVTHCLNGTDLSQEEFRDNLRLRYGLLMMYLP